MWEIKKINCECVLTTTKPTRLDEPRDKVQIRKDINNQQTIWFKPKHSPVELFSFFYRYHGSSNFYNIGSPKTTEITKTTKMTSILIPENAFARGNRGQTDSRIINVALNPTRWRSSPQDIHSRQSLTRMNVNIKPFQERKIRYRGIGHFFRVIPREFHLSWNKRNAILSMHFLVLKSS